MRAGECVTDPGLEFFCRFQAVSHAFNGMLTAATVFSLGAVVLGVAWVYTIPENPPCPACGHRSRTDYGVCRWCGHIFLRPSAAQP